MGKPTETRRAEIIESALAVAAEQGVAAVTTQAIADRVGIAQSTIFRHFRSRDEIFFAAINWLGANMLQTLEPCFSGAGPADERLRKLIQTQLEYVSKNKGLPRILFSDRLHLESPELKQNVQRVMRNFTSRVAQLLQEGMESGRFDNMLDPETTARQLVMLIQGLLMRWSVFDFDFDLVSEAESLGDFVARAIKST
ncbi:TetR/AcrR family transcriptional regulator [Sedimenticola sp.]|uniref:TetR/AcrR family transcriptional regulator n=1 Tax=Sedimenticola sp. TaxID=1940285 RepID=UPI003D0D9D60